MTMMPWSMADYGTVSLNAFENAVTIDLHDHHQQHFILQSRETIDASTNLNNDLQYNGTLWWPEWQQEGNQTMVGQRHRHQHHCSPRFLQLTHWLIVLLDLLLASLAILFNALLVPSAFFARPIPFTVRRSLSAICLSYALLGAILFAKRCFWLISALATDNIPIAITGQCMPSVSSMACKLQEFPVVFIYLHSMSLPLILAIRVAVAAQLWWRRLEATGTDQCMDGRRKSMEVMDVEKGLLGNRERGNSSICFDNHRAHPNRHIVLTRQLTSHANKSLSQIRFPPLPRKSISSVPLPYWLCSTQHILAIVVFMGMALVFTISDPQHEAAAGKRKMMANCSIVLAIRQKTLVFALLSLILLSQLLQAVIWCSNTMVLEWRRRSKEYSGGTIRRHRKKSILLYLAFSCRDLFLLESLGWSLVALLTGLSLLQQHVLAHPCSKCTRLAVQLFFTSLPLLIALAHPLLCLLLIAPVRYAAQRFCPILARIFPTQEPVTPPLPRPSFPTVRILITEH